MLYRTYIERLIWLIQLGLNDKCFKNTHLKWCIENFKWRLDCNNWLEEMTSLRLRPNIKLTTVLSHSPCDWSLDERSLTFERKSRQTDNISRIWSAQVKYSIHACMQRPLYCTGSSWAVHPIVMHSSLRAHHSVLAFNESASTRLFLENWETVRQKWAQSLLPPFVYGHQSFCYMLTHHNHEGCDVVSFQAEACQSCTKLYCVP